MSSAPSAPAGAAFPEEQVLTMPAAWRSRVHPRRGGRAVPAVAIEETPPAELASLAREDAEITALETALTSPDSEADAVEAACAFLDGHRVPLGAAVVASVRVGGTGAGYDRLFERHVDAWIAEHGLVFAARAYAEYARLAVSGQYRGYKYRHLDPNAIRFADPDEDSYRLWQTRHVGRKLRALLAAAGDDEYENAVKLLADHRLSPYQQAMVSYLVPTRQDWVDECCTTFAPGAPTYSGWLLWASLGTPEQAVSLNGRLRLGYGEAAVDILATILDGAGPAIAPALLEALGTGTLDARTRKLFLQVLTLLPTDEAFQGLLDRIGDRYVLPAVASAAGRFPARALRLLAPASAETSKAARLAAETLRAHLPAHPDVTARVLPAMPAADRAVVEPLAASLERRAEAPAATLPPLLTAPPWTRRRKAAEPPVITGLEPPDRRSAVWEPGERDAWSTEGRGRWHQRADADELIGKLTTLPPYQQAALLLEASAERVVPLLETWVPPDMWYVGHRIRPIVARFGLDALPLALRTARANPASWGGCLLPFLDPEVAALQANWLTRLKTARGHAAAWFGRHGAEAVPMLLPAALGGPGAERAGAEGALRHLAARLGSAAVTEAARPYGDRAVRALETMLATDPLEVLPARVPKAPAWADTRLLPQILLRDRDEALPAESAGHLLTMLAMSRPDGVYPGVPIVRDLCDPASLAEFSWSLFRRWRAHDAPAKDGWVLTQLGLLGDDETVRRLAPLIRAWPGEGGHTRAVQGLDVLAAIGTDVALTHLHAISSKVKFKGLRTRAQEKIEEVAARLELTPEQLADRLVPDFGLDARGGLTLDYGPRRFTVAFDEQLGPYVLDENGKRRRDLPKPGAKDDPGLAPAAYKTYTALKKDVRTVAADQIARLETAMVTGRRWPLAEFQEFFVEHPLLWHLVRRLVWTAESGGTTTAFRLAEDRTFADADDDAITLPPDSTISLAHPLTLGTATAAWSALFADYEILQPFPQLGRTVHELAEHERAAASLPRFEGLVVPVGKVLGLTRRGWRRGEPLDAGIEPWISREITPGHHLVISLDPGIIVGEVEEFPEQTLEEIRLSGTPDLYGPAPGGPDAPPLRFGDLPPTLISELLADLTDLETSALSR
ncbi:DUF4132 domain-containing protein [Spirillospora sp. NPDC029432]|uniref:DUF4132 domain-containing protein n=1 Tax=Spirillospora sp. NPDC029432 TaxID=3154599 RepID=UPI003452EBB3